MQRLRSVLLIAVALISVLPLAAAAQVERDFAGAEWIVPLVANVTRQKTSRQVVLDVMEDAYWGSEVDGRPGISEQDHQIGVQMQAVIQRRAFLQKNWLPFDLDGNGVVTRTEIEAVSRQKAIEQIRKDAIPVDLTSARFDQIQQDFTDQVLKNYGENADDITLSDAIAATARKYTPLPPGARPSQMVPLAFDRNGDGSVSLEEFRLTTSLAFAMLDTNSDGQVTPEEHAAAQELIRSLRRRLMEGSVK